MAHLVPRVLLMVLSLTLVACGGGGSSTDAVDRTNDVPPAGSLTATSLSDESESPMTSPPPAAPPPEEHLVGRNRLGAETSPYLLQHQHNPVHWWPWGPEAFAVARALDKPIFLSVGYSTCYWCHVMERESFENDDVAAIMNEHFVCIKVDREERPDVDDIYMSSVQIFAQMTTGRASGGWPMSVFLEPEALKPFYAGTYYPREAGPGRPSFPQLLNFIAESWEDKRADLLRQADQIAERVTTSLSERVVPQPVGPKNVERAITQLLSAYDENDGGFGRGQNKFPTPGNLDLLLDAGWEVRSVRTAVTHTLDRMAMGGMYDQIGGGFHRYATDRQWLVPHFEKMLYDNGQLASTYATAYAATRDPYYAEIVRETLDYVLREMTDDRGLFFSAQDAEVDHREGANYIWTPDEMREALTAAGHADDIDFALEVYGLTAGPNFRDQHHPEDPRWVLFLEARPEALAERRSEAPDAFASRLAGVNDVLRERRDRRPQPITDDKILTGWNGLMIAGLADGGRVLGESRYVEAAARAGDALYDHHRTRGPDPTLLRTSRAGVARIDAFLEDHAYLLRGMLALHEATGQTRWLDRAVWLCAEARTHFWDDELGGYFDTRPDQDDLFVRVKGTYDGATPSANAEMLNGLVALAERTGESGYVDDAVATVRGLSTSIAQQPLGCVRAVQGLHRLAEAYPDGLDLPFTVRTGDGQAPVRVSASPERVELAANGSATVDVKIRIAQGFHINAHEPGLDDLIALTIALVGGEGVSMTVAYPPGHAIDGPVGRALVYEGSVTVPVTLRRTGAITGRPRLTVTSQACTDRMCMQPATDILDVDITGRP